MGPFGQPTALDETHIATISFVVAITLAIAYSVSTGPLCKMDLLPRNDRSGALNIARSSESHSLPE
jgi:hypothetical protein